MKLVIPARRLINARRSIPLAATCFLVLTLVGRVPSVFAAAGDLDAGFGTGGKVTTDFGFGGNDTGFAVVVQPDGKIVSAGQCLGSFCLVRHNADGSLDDGGPDDSTPGDAFGVGGSVVTGFGTDTAAPTSMVRQPDGKLVVLGSCGAVTTNVCIIRDNIDGLLDDGGPNDPPSDPRQEQCTMRKTSSLLALTLIAMLAAPALAQDDTAGHGASSLHEGQPHPFSGRDDDDRRREREVEQDPLDRWQREDHADHLEERRERRDDEPRRDEREGADD